MATQTTNYNFTLPADGDAVDQTPFNNNFTAIDGLLVKVVPAVKATAIDNTALATLFEGVATGELATEITGGATAMAGVVRAYKTSSTDSIQIAEAIDGTRTTRYYTSSAWSSWA